MLDGGYPGYADAQVTVLDKLTYAGNIANLSTAHPRLTFVRGDICDRPLLDDLLPGTDAVVHFAAESHVDRSLSGPAAFVTTNVQGTQTVLEACRHAGVGRVVHVSTDEVYGSIERGSWTEEWPLAPNSPYSATKAGSDLMARAYARSFQLDVSITRCSNNYGPYQHPEKMIPRFVTNLFRGEPVPLYGDGRNSREWLHVDDHCRAIQLVLEHGRAGEAYNVGGGVELTNRELTARLLQLCNADWTAVHQVADRAGHDLRYALDGGKLHAETGYRAQVGIDEGLAGVVAWYRDNPSWWSAADRTIPALAG